jgi:hypothetical protein
MENTYFNRLTLTGLNEKNRKNGNAPCQGGIIIIRFSP